MLDLVIKLLCAIALTTWFCCVSWIHYPKYFPLLCFSSKTTPFHSLEAPLSWIFCSSARLSPKEPPNSSKRRSFSVPGYVPATRVHDLHKLFVWASLRSSLMTTVSWYAGPRLSPSKEYQSSTISLFLCSLHVFEQSFPLFCPLQTVPIRCLISSTGG